MIKRQLLRESNRSLLFPDVATDGDTILCCYIKTENHQNRGDSVLMCSVSNDKGVSWEHSRIFECPNPDVQFLNAPSIAYDKGVFIVGVDVMDRVRGVWPADFMSMYQPNGSGRVEFFMTTGKGQAWSPVALSTVPKTTGICPSFFYKDHDYGIVTQKMNLATGKWHPVFWRPKRGFVSEVPCIENAHLNEGVAVPLDSDVIVMLMRSDSMTGEPAYRSISIDGGKTWSRPEKFCLPCGAHRPRIIRLHTGDYMATFRFFPAARYNQTTMMAVMPAYTLTAPRYAQTASMKVLDHTDYIGADQGYTGLCQLKDNSIFVVNYLQRSASEKTRIYFYNFRLEDEFPCIFERDWLEREVKLNGTESGA